jgi:tetratricopeptide (TPR) repeat protein
MAMIPTTRLKELEDRLENIRTLHGRDGEILYRLANIRYRQGRLEEALVLINEAVDTGYQSPEVLLRRAELYRFQENPKPAMDDVQKVLNSSEATYFEASLAVRMLQALDSEGLKRIPDSPALTALDFDERLAIAHELLTSYDSLPTAEVILSSLVDDRDASVAQHERAINELSICLIGLGRFREAMHAISPVRPEPAGLGIQDAFNYAMAEWAETGVLPRDLFQRVIDLDRQNPEPDRGPNHTQCLAIAHWAVGDIEQAYERISRARQQIMARRSPEFSAWCYLTTSVDQFISDLEGMLMMINGKYSVVPRFMKNAQGGSKGGSA